jgi:hypothetical protein
MGTKKDKAARRIVRAEFRNDIRELTNETILHIVNKARWKSLVLQVINGILVLAVACLVFAYAQVLK